MNKQELLNQIMEQLSQDKNILSLVEQLQIMTPKTSTQVEEHAPVYHTNEQVPIAALTDLPQPYLHLLQRTVQTTLEAVEVVLVPAKELKREEIIAQSFSRFDEVYKALS